MKYRQSRLYQNVIEELDHVNQNIAGMDKSEEASNYATSFFYQVSKSVAVK